MLDRIAFQGGSTNCVAALPAPRDPVPECNGDCETLEDAVVVDGTGDEFAAHAVKLRRRILKIVLDLLQREGVIGALVPVRRIVDGVKIETDRFGLFAPVRPLLAGNAPHGR